MRRIKIIVECLLEDNPLREAAPARVTVTEIHDGHGRGSKRTPAPMIRLSGKWLADIGFHKGSTARLSTRPGEIRLIAD